MNKTILVTGSNGFIGQHLLNYLFQKGHQVITFARKDLGINRSKHFFLENCVSQILLEFKPDFIFHLATCVQTNSLYESMEINCQFAMRLLDAIKLNELRGKTKLIIFGSAAEYGLVEESNLPIKETQTPRPISHYGISKLAQTQMSLSSSLKQNVLCIRPFTVLGKSMPLYMAMGNFVDQIKKLRVENKTTENFLHVGNLETVRDFIDIEDAIELIWLLANKEESFGKIVNLCSGIPVSLGEMVQFLIEQSDRKIQILPQANRMRSNDVKINYGDNTLLKSLTHFAQFQPWKKTLTRILQP